MNFWGCSLGCKSALRFGVKGSAGHALHIHPLSSPHGIPTAHYSLTVQPADGGLRDVRYQWTRNGSRPDTTAVADYTNLHRTCDQDVPSHGSCRNICAKPGNVFGRKSAGRAKARRPESEALWFHGVGFMLPGATCALPPGMQFWYSLSCVAGDVHLLVAVVVPNRMLRMYRMLRKPYGRPGHAERQSWQADRAELLNSLLHG